VKQLSRSFLLTLNEILLCQNVHNILWLFMCLCEIKFALPENSLHILCDMYHTLPCHFRHIEGKNLEQCDRSSESQRKRSLGTMVEVKKREGFIGSGFPAALEDSFEGRHLVGGPFTQIQEKTPETIAP
jgi:hypothetical protein